MALQPGMTMPTAAIQSAFGMMAYLAFKKGVKDEAYQEIMDLVLEGVAHIEGIKAEFRVLTALKPDLPEEKVAALVAATELSEKAINHSRRQLYEKLELLRQCKQPGVTIH